MNELHEFLRIVWQHCYRDGSFFPLNAKLLVRKKKWTVKRRILLFGFGLIMGAEIFYLIKNTQLLTFENNCERIKIERSKYVSTQCRMYISPCKLIITNGIFFSVRYFVTKKKVRVK